MNIEISCYHGLKAKDKSFNAEMKTDFDGSIGKINIIPQDIGRVLLNLYNNAFYAVSEKQKACQAEPVEAGYEPIVSVGTKKLSARNRLRQVQPDKLFAFHLPHKSIVVQIKQHSSNILWNDIDFSWPSKSVFISALKDLRLAYHGLKAKDKSFNAEMKTDFDGSIGKINIIPQDIGRVLLNLYNNAFYAVSDKAKSLSFSG